MAEGLLTEAQMNEALAWKQKTRRRFGEVLTELGFVLEEHVIGALAKQFDHPVVDLDATVPEPEAVKLVTQAFAVQYLCLPIKADEFAVTVAIPDPLDIATIDLLATTLKRRVEVALATPTSLKRAIIRAYKSNTAAPRSRRVKKQKDRAMLLELIDTMEPKPAKTNTLKEAS